MTLTFLSRKFTILAQIFLIFQLLIYVVNPVSSQALDGVIVTESDYQSLQAFRNELIDPKGFLKSWKNGTIFGACSGIWEGIKCAKGQVIGIHLPWRGLGGRITEKIGQFQALRKLSLHDNVITGLIPISLGFLPDLISVQLFNNRFSGSIPSSLGLCHFLETLDVGNNSLSGKIPENLGSLTKLVRLNMSHNFLTGSIPVNLTQSPSLTFLALENNNLSGTIPNSWEGNGKQKAAFQIQVLTLDRNFFVGSIPPLGKLRGIQEISLSHNRLSGVIPNDISDLVALRKLDLSHNFIEGEIPPFLGDLPNLDSFNVSYNNLSSLVPLKLSQKFNSTAFVGNFRLCGYSSSTPCPISPSQAPTSTPLAPKKRRKRLSIKDIISILAGTLVVLLLICCIILFFLIRKRKMSKEQKIQADSARGETGISLSVEIEGGKLVHFGEAKVFSADDLLCANAEIIGKSTYGTVYKATMEDGIQVAVKRLKEKITKGKREFEAEINVLGKIRHPNLLALRAYYSGPKGEKLLVFHYMPKGNLATLLHARTPDMPFDWPARMKIAKGMTRGLFYLHHNANIIHGNLTSSNVILDEHKTPKIGDFGLYRLMIKSRNLKQATMKTDIYNLGMIILELLTGKSSKEGINDADLPHWVASMVKEERNNEVFDSELMKDFSSIGDELLKMLKLALSCVDSLPLARPEAHEILQQMEEIIRPETEDYSSGDDDDNEAMASV